MHYLYMYSVFIFACKYIFRMMTGAYLHVHDMIKLPAVVP